MEITPNLIASLVQGTVEGDGNVKITGFGSIEEAGEGCITFIANPKYEHYIYTTKATAVLVKEGFHPEKEVKPVLIYVKDPYSTLAELLTAMKSMEQGPVGVEQPVFVADGVHVPENIYLGAFCYIGKGVKLGENVKIYPQAYVGDNVEIGDNTIIYPGVKIYKECKIGKGCVLHSGCVIGADGFGFAPKDGKYEKIPQIGNVVIADDVEIGANTCVDRATFGSTMIGEGTKLDNLIQIAHNVRIGRSNVMASQGGVAGSAEIGDYNMFGGQVGIAGHIKIGSFNQVGAQSGIPNNVGDKKRLMGYPAVDARQFAKNLVYIKKLEELLKK